MADDLIRQYLKEIGQYALLTGADEVRLARVIEAGRLADLELSAPEDGNVSGVDEVECEQGQPHGIAIIAAELEPFRPDPAGPHPARSDPADLKAKSIAGRDAKQEFIQSNLRLVVSIAKRYQPCGLPLIDLIQEGNLGLMRAVDRFDYRKGFKFSTYATWWIRQAIGRAIADKSRTIRVPMHMVEVVGHVARATSALRGQLGRTPSASELAADTGYSIDKVRDAQRVMPDPVSIFEHVGDDDVELADFLEDPSAQLGFDDTIAAIEHQQLRGVLANLAPREQRILELRFGLADGRAHTLEEVAGDFKLTRERIRQIEAKAISKLRHPAVLPDGNEEGEPVRL